MTSSDLTAANRSRSAFGVEPVATVPVTRRSTVYFVTVAPPGIDSSTIEERPDGSARIEQTIYVMRESQKKIVLGAHGATIRTSPAAAGSRLRRP